MTQLNSIRIARLLPRNCQNRSLAWPLAHVLPSTAFFVKYDLQFRLGPESVLPISYRGLIAVGPPNSNRFRQTEVGPTWNNWKRFSDTIPKSGRILSADVGPLAENRSRTDVGPPSSNRFRQTEVGPTWNNWKRFSDTIPKSGRILFADVGPLAANRRRTDVGPASSNRFRQTEGGPNSASLRLAEIDLPMSARPRSDRGSPISASRRRPEIVFAGWAVHQVVNTFVWIWTFPT